MSYTGSIKITNRDGWSRTIDLEKSLYRIGSLPSNEIALPEAYGSGVQPLHLQVFAAAGSGPNGGVACRVVNLAGQPLQVFAGGLISRGQVAPHATFEIGNDQVIQLGDFTLHFLLSEQKGANLERRSENLGMLLQLPRLDLEPGKSITGLLSLTNYGEQKHCQFSIELDGIPQDCFQVSPAPLLYPGATEELPVRFFHRGVQPPAGPLQITLSASAAFTYPTERLVLPLVLQVAPLHRYTLEIRDLPQPGRSPATKPEVDANTAAEAAPNPAAPQFPEAFEAADASAATADSPEAFEAGETLVVAASSARPHAEREKSAHKTQSLVAAQPAPRQQSAPSSNPGEPQPQTPVRVPPFLPGTASLPGGGLAGEPALNPQAPEADGRLPSQPANEEGWPPAMDADAPPMEWSNEAPVEWPSEGPTLPASAASDRLGSLKKDIKSRLAGKEIQVIKAGLEIEEEDDETV